MDVQAFATQTFKKLTGEAPASNCSVLIHENGVLVDAGCACTGGWSVAQHVLEGLTGGRGQVGYTQSPLAEGLQMPAVELFLDDPTGAEEVFRPDETGVFGVRTSTRYALGISLKGKTAALSAYGQVVAAEENSLFAHVLEAGSLIACAARQLRQAGIYDLAWAWSSCPIAPMCDDVEESRRRQKALTAQYGTVSLWVRGEEATIRQALKEIQGFHLCVHELATACTYRNIT